MCAERLCAAALDFKPVPCFSPLKGYRAKAAGSGGRRSIVFSPSLGFVDRPVTVPCGQCVGCRLERSRQWAVRCVHEASMHAENCFLTLTYRDEELPPGRSLVKSDFQKFMKRFRKRVDVEFGTKLRFYYCGEYGEQFGRPHYHACIFGFDFPDKMPWKSNSNGDIVYRSAMLEELWTLGHSSVGSVTFQSAAYVARYVMKKVNGAAADEHYSFVDDDGVVHKRLPEYTDMSRRPGIGAGWFDRFCSDVYPDDFVVVNGKKVRPPRFYDKQFELRYPSDFEALKKARKASLRDHAENNTPDRLRVRERVLSARLQRLKREVD